MGIINYHINKDNNKYIIAYHSQDSRGKPLTEPLICRDDEAWLGEGYYFWTDFEFAKIWGKAKKAIFSEFIIYKTFLDVYNTVDSEVKFLNYTFNEEDYNFFCEMVEKALKNCQGTPNLHKVMAWLSVNVWRDIGIIGIMYDDLPRNSNHNTYSEIVPLYYKKRIQIVIYDKKYIKDFAFCLKMPTR